jgi:hypothetical protein
VELGKKQGGDEDGKRMDGAVLYGLFLFREGEGNGRMVMMALILVQ